MSEFSFRYNRGPENKLHALAWCSLVHVHTITHINLSFLEKFNFEFFKLLLLAFFHSIESEFSPVYYHTLCKATIEYTEKKHLLFV